MKGDPVLHQGVPTISVRNLESSIDYYTGILGFEVVHRFDPHIAYVAGAGMLLALVPERDAGATVESPRINIGFFVANLDDARRDLEKKGVAFLGEPVEAYLARVTFFNDPDGTPLYLCQWLQLQEPS